MLDLRRFRDISPGTQPEYLHPAYVSSCRRAPTKPLIVIPQTLTELTGPVFGHDSVVCWENDLTAQGTAHPQGERIVVHGRVSDEEERPVPGALIEVWQANAAGRYRHKVDQHLAPIDPNFWGAGRFLTDTEGYYRMTTVKPGAYPWGNHHNAWRPAHIHFSLFGAGLLTRLVTQMYFPGDPLLPFDPIYNCVSDVPSRERMVAAFDWSATVPDIALGFRYDIVLRGRHATPVEPHL